MNKRPLRALGPMLSYKKEDIHLVWILNDIEIAKQQNAERARRVPEEILVATHKGAAVTMGEILNQTTDISHLLNGDITVVFNRRDLDTEIEVSPKGGKWVKSADYVVVKKSGEGFDKSRMLTKFTDKINDLTGLKIF